MTMNDGMDGWMNRCQLVNAKKHNENAGGQNTHSIQLPRSTRLLLCDPKWHKKYRWFVAMNEYYSSTRHRMISLGIQCLSDWNRCCRRWCLMSIRCRWLLMSPWLSSIGSNREQLLQMHCIFDSRIDIEAHQPQPESHLICTLCSAGQMTGYRLVRRNSRIFLCVFCFRVLLPPWIVYHAAHHFSEQRRC